MNATATVEKQTNGIAPNNDVKAVTYVPIGEKEALTLTIGQVQKILCVKTKSGKIAGPDDIIKFMMLCKASGLNPWVNDAYLVGYDTQDGPKYQLITAHQALLKRAELSSEFDGIESGVCVTMKDGTLQERQGDLVLPGETLVGVWARVHRRDRKIPSYDSLSLKTFSTGKSRWSADPSGMIVKCAEASALRKAFPSTLAQMYCKEEMDRQLESGERIQRDTSNIDTPAATKSDSIALMLASRRTASQEKTETKEPEQETNHVENDTLDAETETNEPERQSQLRECVKFLKEKNVPCVESDPEGLHLKYSLPNDEILCISDGQQASSIPGVNPVDTLDADAITQVINIFDAANKKKK